MKNSALVFLAGFLAILTALAASPSFARKRRKPLVDSALSSASYALTPAPADNEICFSPDEPCDAKIVKFVQSARRSIDIAIYDINLDPLVHALLVQSRKIPVRVIVDRRQARERNSAVRSLIRAGVELRYGRQRGIMHNKFTLVDGRRLETGSFNYTHHAYSSNQENQLYLSVPSIVARYEARFEKMWTQATRSGED